MDICILCALLEEAKAVRKEFESRSQHVSFQTAFTREKKYLYWHATIKNLRGEPLTILVMAMPFPGPVETPIFVQALLAEFRPRFMAMTGICAGDRKVAIGDLVVASYAFHHDAGKIEPGKERQDQLRPEWRTAGPQSRVLMYAQALTDWKRPLIEMKQRLLGRDLLPEEYPRCLLAPIASGMAVQGNNPFPYLQEHNRKVVFLDQEVAAFYRTLQEPPEVPFLAVKSVCDNGDPAKNDHYHDYAARASAIYLLHFIQEYVNEETMPRPHSAWASDRVGPSGFWNVPYLRNPHFTGREELLDQLEQRLSPVGQEDAVITHRTVLTQAQAIKGLGGIGKTQIAVEYAYRSQDCGRYLHTFWVNAATQETIMISFREIAALLPSFPAKDETDHQKLLEAIKSWLEQCEYPWLLILDNAFEDDVDPSVIQSYLPRSGKGSILLTTRVHAVGALAASLEVDIMGWLEGTHLLLRRAQRFEHASDDVINRAGDIVVALDHFPLALDQAGAYLEETGCSFADYLDRYQTHQQKILARRGNQVTRYPDSVATTWSLSFQKVQFANPAAAELLHLCSFLAPDRIPEELITDGARHWNTQLQQAAIDPFSFDQMITELLKYSLVTRLAETHMLSIHRLVQAVQMDTIKLQTQHQWAERVVRAVNDVFPDHPRDTSTWPLCLRYLDQAQACSLLIERYELQSLEAVNVLHLAGSYLYENALYATVEPLWKRVLAIREQVWGESHPDTARSLNNLAELRQKQGKYADAEVCYKRALAIAEQEPRRNAPLTATILNNLSVLYKTTGNYKKAEVLMKQALVIDTQVYGTDHPNIAIELNNLALLYNQQGQYRKAEPLLKRALAIRERELGTHHLQTAVGLNNLGGLYQQRRKYAKAEPLLKRALAIRERELGADHPQTVASLNNLAELYRSQERYEEAEQLYRRTLAIHQHIFGDNHLNTAITLNNLAFLSIDRSNYMEAASLFARALPVFEQVLGKEHQNTKNAQMHYTVLIELLKQSEQSEEAMVEGSDHSSPSS